MALMYCTFHMQNLYAQDLESTIEKLKTFKHLSYTATKREKDFFSDKVYDDTLVASFELSENKRLFRVFGMRNADWHDGNKLIRFSLPDSTYRIVDANAFSGFEQMSIPKIIKSLEKNLGDKVPVHQLKDSVIAQKKYAHYQIVEFDSIKNDQRVYRHKKILIDKETSLPFYYREDQQGFINDTDMHIDHFAEYHYSNYEPNTVRFDLSYVEIPEGFNLEVPKKRLLLLEPGVQAPELALLDSMGTPFQLKDHRGKLILLNFSLVGCPHCVKSIETLNELYVSLENEDFEIVTIHARDDEDAVKKMNQKFGVKYPHYNNTEDARLNIENYQVDAYPIFYLIDKKGYIIKGINGYSKSIGEDIKKLIMENLSI